MFEIRVTFVNLATPPLPPFLLIDIVVGIKENYFILNAPPLFLHELHQMCFYRTQKESQQD